MGVCSSITLRDEKKLHPLLFLAGIFAIRRLRNLNQRTPLTVLPYILRRLAGTRQMSG